MFSDEEKRIFKFEINGEKKAIDPIGAIARFNETLRNQDITNIHKKLFESEDEKFREYLETLVLQKFITRGVANEIIVDGKIQIHLLDQSMRDTYTRISDDVFINFTESSSALAPAIAAGFKVKQFSEDAESDDGATISQLLDIYKNFLSWNSNVKKNTDSMPNSSEPIQESTLLDMEPSLSDTKPLTDSGSIGSGKTVAAPGSSLTA